jgi:serine/threonine protein kinase
MGVGGFGCVLAAKDKASKKNVALKIIVKDENDDYNINHVKMLK